MDCRESRELLSGAVDNELKNNESRGFFDHIEICRSCHDEFELERLTKAYIKRKITFVDVPYDLESAIMAQLFSEDALLTGDGFFGRLISNSIFQPVAAVGAVLVIAVLLFFANKANVIMPISPEGSVEAIQASGADALTIAMNNFQEVLDGTFKTQITAITVADVSSFLNQNAGYHVPVPSISDADWIAGSVTGANGTRNAHIVYKIGEDYIYIYTFPRTEMATKDVLLPSGCAQAINSNKCYWGTDENGDTQAVWTSNGNVFVATANIEKDDLSSYLKLPNGAGQ